MMLLKKRTIYILILVTVLVGCAGKETTTKFPEDALNDTFITLEGDSIALKDILKQFQGATMVIDIWASWCSDCIKGMPKEKNLHQTYKDVVYIYLSLDRSIDAWKKGIEKYKVQGHHYYMPSGKKSPFGDFVEIDWIPRYLVLDGQGNIKVFKTIEADDKKLIKALKR